MYLKFVDSFQFSKFSKSVSKKICRHGKDGNTQNLESSQHMWLSFYSGSVGSFMEDPKYEIYPEIEYMLTGGRGKT